jgi:hypothetical protein
LLNVLNIAAGGPRCPAGAEPRIRGPAALLAALFVIPDPSARILGFVNGGAALIFVSAYLLRARLTIVAKVALLCAVGTAVAVPSLLLGGCLGTGLIVLVLMQVITLVYIRGWHAGIVGAATILFVGVAATA